ncbi:metalloprotease [Streptomyces sp. IMTB 2501]|uniref:snapalysin family zinc-dependent metalloprotease n=1 Tax=Streptomyces sp. IMTB 2501 TaxID=1776340 RepID=UPI00096D3880|nr:snapalysin family zinc-dependent metalloprotease [Streptomyces sp. IMTB 2501]OLZ61342.1 metalloprotease [Streptomyces sp. IMTB 2501]
MSTRIAATAALVPAVLAATVGVASAQPAHTAAQPRPAAVVTLTYDDSRAGSWGSAIDRAVANWNAAEHNVQLRKAGSSSSADYTYVATNGWPQTTLGPIFPGSSKGEVDLGQEALNEGYDATRVAAHETGHIFGLPDDYSGPCSELMSGHGPGTSCTNAKPDAAEAAQVDQNYANSRSTALRATHRIDIPDVWSNRTLAHAH